MSHRLAMTLLVRDERDIIAHNIRYHAAQGVDFFMVTDNGSVDGTRELLSALAQDFPMEIIDEPSHTIDQDLWVSHMAERLRARGNEDWVIHNDADEFWVPANGNLKDALARDLAPYESDPHPTAILICPRHNFLPSLQDIELDNYAFYDNRWKVAQPLGFHEAAPDPDQEMRFSNALRALPGKVMCKVDGMGFISHGNHKVDHDGGERRESQNIEVFHYPARSYDQFQVKVRNYGESLKANTRLDREVAWHLRRWYSLYERGELYDEYLNFVLDEQSVRDLQAQGVIVEDARLKAFFAGYQDGVNASK